MNAGDATSTLSRVQVEWVEDNLFVGSDEDGRSIVFDSSLSASPSRRGARARGMGPMKALLTSLGACSGMDAVAILNKRKQKLSSLVVEVSGKRPRHGLPKPYTEIHLNYLVGGDQLDERYVKEAVTDSVTKFCSVAATIDKKAKITFSYEMAMT